MSRIFVTGIGVLSAIGNSVEEHRASLKTGKCGIGALELFQSKYSTLLPCAEIKISSTELRERLKVSESGVTRTTLLAVHAFEQAIADAQLNQTDLSSAGTALIAGSTVGGMCLTDELYQDAVKREYGSEYIESYDCSATAMYLQKRYRTGGIVNTLNTACSSSANAILFGARLIRNDFAKRAIVGGTDSLAKFTINGFNALHILSNEKCRPFDLKRNGLNLGEGAAFLVLEPEEEIGSRKVYAELSGYCNANDAFHPSSLSVDGAGPFLAMQGALDLAKISPNQIGYINAHGTGTENNDLVESLAMLKLFSGPPPFTSTKANTGHTLGAAGALEAAFSILSLHHQELYPALNFSEAIPETALVPVSEYKRAVLKHVMTNSFGFGGNCTSLIFSHS